jgi:hypothetical protein
LNKFLLSPFISSISILAWRIWSENIKLKLRLRIESIDNIFKVKQNRVQGRGLLWGEYHVHRPFFTGRPSGLGSQGKCQVYLSLFTDPTVQVPSLPISLYRSLHIGRWQKSTRQTKCSYVHFCTKKLKKCSLNFLNFFNV